MENAIKLLEDRLGRASVKLARAEKAVETASKEVAELQTALKVFRELTGESGPQVAVASTSERQTSIVGLLPVGPEKAKSPAEVYEAYKLFAEEEINLDTFRTTIWRMKDRTFMLGSDMWLVKGADGSYWRLPGTFETTRRHQSAAEEELHDQQGATAPASDSFDDLDDIPF